MVFSDATSLSPLPPGRLLDRYEVIAPIGSGGMATVYLGRARGAGGFERIVAIKVCHMHLREDAYFVQMFLDEARLAAGIHHPNVVATIDVRDEQELYLVMDYIEGGSLSMLKRAVDANDSLIPLSVALKIIHETLYGLHAAHQLTDNDGSAQGIIHRDVSPQNILVGIDGVTRITDFGVAKAANRAANTRPGEVKGKLAYMAPEQIRGGSVDHRADIFSAAVVLWEILTGIRLFRGNSEMDTASNVLSAPVKKVSTFREGVPPDLDKALRKALDRKPDRRHSSAKEFAREIVECGVPLATHEEVATFVREMLAGHIEERKSLFRTPAKNEPPTVSSVDIEVASQAARAPRTGRPRQMSHLVLAVLIPLILGAATTWLVIDLAISPESSASDPRPNHGPARRSDGDVESTSPRSVPDAGHFEGDATEAGITDARDSSTEAGPPDDATPARHKKHRSWRKHLKGRDRGGNATGPAKNEPRETTTKEFRPLAL